MSVAEYLQSWKYHGPKLSDIGIRIVEMLEQCSEGVLSQKELIARLGVKYKDLRYQIRRLKDQDVILSVANLQDMRSVNYMINPYYVAY